MKKFIEYAKLSVWIIGVVMALAGSVYAMGEMKAQGEAEIREIKKDVAANKENCKELKKELHNSIKEIKADISTITGYILKVDAEKCRLAEHHKNKKKRKDEKKENNTPEYKLLADDLGL